MTGQMNAKQMEAELDRMGKLTENGSGRAWEFPNGYGMSISEVAEYHYGAISNVVIHGEAGLFRLILLKKSKPVRVLRMFRCAFNDLYPHEVIECAKKLAEIKGD